MLLEAEIVSLSILYMALYLQSCISFSLTPINNIHVANPVQSLDAQKRMIKE